MSKMAVDTNQIVEDDEVTLKELILRVKEYFLEIRRRWLVVLLFFFTKHSKRNPNLKPNLLLCLIKGTKAVAVAWV